MNKNKIIAIVIVIVLFLCANKESVEFIVNYIFL